MPFFILSLISSDRVALGSFLQICESLKIASYCPAQA
jgi:hypothetical protein